MVMSAWAFEASNADFTVCFLGDAFRKYGIKPRQTSCRALKLWREHGNRAHYGLIRKNKELTFRTVTG